MGKLCIGGVALDTGLRSHMCVCIWNRIPVAALLRVFSDVSFIQREEFILIVKYPPVRWIVLFQ